MKKLLFSLHLYIGLATAVFLLAISLSGAVIAFEPELNRAFHPDLTNVSPLGTRMNWDLFKAVVEQQSPGWKLVRIYFPDQPDHSTYVRLRNGKTKAIHHVYVNQYTGRILGSTEDGSNWILKVHDLHVNFLSSKIGNQIVTWTTVGLLILSLTGITLWWPRKTYVFRLTSKAPRLNRDLHMSVGFWSFLAMFLFAITGLSLHYQTGKLLDLLNKPDDARLASGHGTSIEGVLQTAREALPGTTIPRLLLPEKKGDTIFVYQRFPEDKTPAGRSFSTIDPKTGALLSSGSSRDAPFLKTALVQYTREIHTGTLFGLPTKILVCVFALGLAVLTITGPLMWINKLRAASHGCRVLRLREEEQARTATPAPLSAAELR